MFQQTPQKRVLFPRTLTKVMVGVFVATFLLTFLAGLFYGAQPAKAATNSTLNFQARLETASGAIVPDGYYNVEFKLYNVNSAGSALWTETYYDANGATAGSDNRVQVRNGYLTANLGSQTAFPGTINWDQDLWVTMNIGGTTQTATPTWDGEMNPRLKLTGVPYAFRAGQLALQTGVNTSTLGFATQTGARNILLPDESGTICIQSSSNCGFAVSSGSANYIQNGTSPQTASFNVTGDGTIGGNLSVGGQQVITSGRVLQNVTANTSILTAGTLGIARGGTGVSTTPTNGQLLIGNGAGYSLATLGVSGGLTVTNSAGGINIGTDSTICTTNGNCVGTGSAGSSIGGSGSTNTIAMFTGAGLIGNSIISQTGTSSIDVSGNILATGINVNNVSTNGTTRIDASGVLQNVTTDASILTSGTIASARITGSYTGITGVGTLNGLSIAANNTFTNSGSTLNTAVALSNFTASAAIGTAAATVNVATAFTVNQTTASIILTLPSPTTTTAGRIVYVSNIGTASFTMYNVVVSPGTTATYLWNGTAWTSAGIDGSGANYIQNQSGSTQTGNFKISGTGVAATLHAATFDAASVSALNIGTTNANAIIIGNTTNTATASVIATTTLNLGNNANNKTVNIGATGSTANTTTVNIATSTGAAQTVNIGSTNGASATTIQGGTGNINLNTNSATASVIVRSNTNSTTAFQVQNAAGASVLLVDTSGQKVNINQSNLAIAGLSAPGTPTFTAGSNSSGSLSGSSSTTYYYKVSAVNGSGESAGSTEASFTGASFTPISAPGAATAALNATAGNLTGTYSYVVTFVTANGETTAGTASNSVTASAQTIDLSSIPLGPSGTTARKIYRTAAGGSTYMLNTTINDNTTTTLTADNVIDGSLGATPPASNTARTNTNTLSVSFTAATGATSYKVYRGTSSGAENVYFTTTTSPFSDTGAAGTAGTPLSLASNGTITTTGTINTNVFTGSALTFGSAAAATISSATNQNLTLQAAGTGSLALLSGSGGISIGSTGSSTSSSTVRIADTTSGTGTQAVTIGSSANAGNALTLEAGNTGKIQIGNSTAAHTIQIGAGGTAAQSVTIGSTSSSSVTTIQAGTGNLNLVTNSASAGVIVKAQSDTATAFQVQASNSSPILNIDTTDTNLLAGLNGGFESNPLTSWVAKNGGSVARSTAQRYTGNASGQITTTATAGSGIQVPYTFAANTQYTLSLYARLSSGSMSTFVIGRQDVSGTDVNGLTGQTLSANGWTRLTWTFTTGGTITSSNIYVNQSDATVRAGTMFIDSVQLETGASATAYGGGNIQMNATVTSPFSIRNTSDSTTAFTIQNATGTTNLMNVDTLNNTINLGANLQVAGMTVLTTGRVLQNVTTDASILTSGTIASARISGSYTGITGVGTLNGLSVATNNTFTNAGSTLNSAVALSNFAANAAIGTAAATVDGVTTFTINQTTANITLTMPNPTATTAGRIVYISNIGTASFTMYNVVVSPGNTATYLWNGSAWTSAGIDGSGANYIQNQSGSTQSANFKISGTGVANLLQASTFDAASATTMNLGTTNATGVNLATNAIAHAISIGTGAAAQTVTIGSTNTTSTTTLQAGSGSVNLFGNTSSLTTATARVLQGGTGDALLEFNNSGLGKSFYIGQDTSSGGNFIINSSTSATASTVSTPTFVQSITVGSTASATTTASTFTTTAGNLIVVSLSFASSGTTFTCTDNRGDTFSNAAQVTNSGQTAGICYAPNVAGGSTTVTVTYGAASTFRAIILSEYSGVATSNPVDVTSVNTGTATTATDNVTSNSATTTQTGDLIVGLVDDITGNAVVSAGTGYTPRQASAAGERILVQDKVFNGTGTVASTNTFSTPDVYNSVLVAFKPVVTTGTNTDNFTNPMLRITQAGAALFKNSTDSTTAFQIQSTNGTSLFGVDSVNKIITLGTGLQGAGLSSDCSDTSSKLLWNSTSKQFSCGTDGASYTIRKPADEVVTNSTALQNDDDFTFPVGANQSWAFEINTGIVSNTTADIKFAIAAPSGSTCRMDVTNLYNAWNESVVACNFGITLAMNQDTDTEPFLITGVVNTGANGGAVTLQWAQATSNAVNTTMRANTHMNAFKISGADLAEIYYSNDNTIVAGDVVTVDGSLKAGVKKSQSAYDSAILGIVSTKPGMVLGDASHMEGGKPVLLALAGRVPVKVTNENGAIKAGDYLTTSATRPGYAMKATAAGYTIGKAIEAFSGDIGTVMVFTNIGWYPGEPTVQSAANNIQNGATAELSGLVVTGTASMASLNVSGPTKLTSLTVSGSVVVSGTLTVEGPAEFTGDISVKGTIKVQNIEVSGHFITSGDIPTADLLTAAGSDTTVTIEGNDTSGTITVAIGVAKQGDRLYKAPTEGELVTLNFVKEYTKKPRVMIVGGNSSTAKLDLYPSGTNQKSFNVGLSEAPEPGQTYTFEYFVVQ